MQYAHAHTHIHAGVKLSRNFAVRFACHTSKPPPKISTIFTAKYICVIYVLACDLCVGNAASTNVSEICWTLDWNKLFFHARHSNHMIAAVVGALEGVVFCVN